MRAESLSRDGARKEGQVEMTSVRAVIQHEGRILFLQRSSGATRPDQWCLPGGRIWQNESAEKAVRRETFEETGLRIRVGQILGCWRGCSYFLCRLAAAPESLVLAERESQAARWIEPTDLENLGEIMDYRLIKPLLGRLAAD